MRTRTIAAPYYVRGVSQGCLQVGSFTLTRTDGPLGEERDTEASASLRLSVADDIKAIPAKSTTLNFLVIGLHPSSVPCLPP